MVFTMHRLWTFMVFINRNTSVHTVDTSVFTVDVHLFTVNRCKVFTLDRWSEGRHRAHQLGGVDRPIRMHAEGPGVDQLVERGPTNAHLPGRVSFGELGHARRPREREARSPPSPAAPGA